jgi:hypothetical protein
MLPQLVEAGGPLASLPSICPVTHNASLHLRAERVRCKALLAAAITHLCEELCDLGKRVGSPPQRRAHPTIEEPEEDSTSLALNLLDQRYVVLIARNQHCRFVMMTARMAEHVHCKRDVYALGAATLPLLETLGICTLHVFS